MELRGHIELLKIELDRHRHCGDTAELWHHVFNLEAELGRIEDVLDGPARLTITSSQNGTHMNTYDLGTTVDLKSTVRNAKGTAIAADLTWSSDQGTVITGPNGTADDGTVFMTAQLVNVPSPGDVTVTAATTNGVTSDDVITFADPADAIPATMEISDSAAPAAA